MKPLTDEVASGIVSVWVAVAGVPVEVEDHPKVLVVEVDIAKRCVVAVYPLKEDNPLLPQYGIVLPEINTWPSVPLPNLLKVLAALA